MRVEFAEQYSVPCVAIDGTETADEVIRHARESEAVYYEDGPDDECFVIQFPDRPQELYTGEALRRSLGKPAATTGESK